MKPLQSIVKSKQAHLFNHGCLLILCFGWARYSEAESAPLRLVRERTEQEFPHAMRMLSDPTTGRCQKSTLFRVFD